VGCRVECALQEIWLEIWLSVERIVDRNCIVRTTHLWLRQQKILCGRTITLRTAQIEGEK